MKFEKLESLRGLAAIYVVMHHSVPHDLKVHGLDFGLLFRFGQEAVILFFLLSGFVVNYSHRKSKNGAFNVYFFKRFSRIYIPLFFIYALGYLHVCLQSNSFVDPELGNLLKNIFMLQDVESLKPNVLASPYMGNTPLWSLSYEWWFYMLYFPIQRQIQCLNRQNTVVFGVATLAAVFYIFYPYFIFRLLMYLSIWWAGVFISNLVIDEKPLKFKSCFPVFICLGLIILTTMSAIVLFLKSGGKPTIGVHPFLEARHHIFALFSVVVAIAWKKFNWWGFKQTIGPFKNLAPISYVVYISHHYLVVNATYLSFIGNKIVEFFFYIFVLLAFSWLIELKLTIGSSRPVSSPLRSDNAGG